MIWSATLMISRLCSMISTLLPESTRRWRTSISLCTSAACNPTEGSSNTYSVLPVARRESSLAKLDPLGLTSGKGGGGLADADISQTNSLEGIELVHHCRESRENLQRLVYGEVQYLGDIQIFEAHLKRLTIEASAMANVARHVNIGEELHFDAQLSLALASLTAPTMYIERKPARLISADFAFR
jgi:hypothetical protein